MLSIIVPIYNSEKFLKRCVASILAQTYSNYELILVDDGSTDRSSDICDEYARMDERIRVIHKENRGLILARMTGLEVAIGNYIAFVDSDDWMDEDLIEMLMNPLLRDNSVDISVSPYVWGNEADSRSRFQEHETAIWNAKDALLFMMRDQWFGWSMVSKVYRKELFSGIEIWFPNNSYGEDLEINWKVFQNAKKIYFQPLLGYHYYNNPESMTHKIVSEGQLIFLKRMDRIIDSVSRKETVLLKTCAYTFCTKVLSRFLDYLHNRKENADVTDYKAIIKKNFDIIKEDLTPEEIQNCEYAMMDMCDFQKEEKKKFEKLVKECDEFIKRYDNTFVYGAGEIASQLSDVLEKNDIDFSGYVISGKGKGCLAGKSVYSFSDIWDARNGSCGFILAMDKRNSGEVKEMLAVFSIDAYIDVGAYFPSYLTGSRDVFF